jgi:hypothetical protein
MHRLQTVSFLASSYGVWGDQSKELPRCISTVTADWAFQQQEFYVAMKIYTYLQNSASLKKAALK